MSTLGKASDDVRWIQSWSRGAGSEFRIGRAGDQLVAQWVGVAELRASRSGAPYAFSTAPHLDEETTRKFHDNLVTALLRHCSGGLTLHAASIAGPAGAVAILGDGGDGKSTLAAAACRRPGVCLLGDDTAPVDIEAQPPRVGPSARVTWLLSDARRFLHGCPASASSVRKVPCGVARLAEHPLPLRALVKLAWSYRAEPALRRLRGREAFEPISLAAVRFVLDEPDVQLRDFDQVASLASRVAVFELSRPRALEQLESSVDVLASLLTDAP